jgi:hypothetical protein
MMVIYDCKPFTSQATACFSEVLAYIKIQRFQENISRSQYLVNIWTERKVNIDDDHRFRQ